MLINKKNKNGFTLIELLVVVAIIGILVVVATPALFKNIDKAKLSDVEADYSAMKSAALSYYAEKGSLEQIKQDELLEYIDGEVIDKSPLGGYYQIFSTYDQNNIIPGSGEEKYWTGRKVTIEDNQLVYGNEIKLKEEGSLFVGLRNVVASEERLKKLVNDIGENNIYVYIKDKTETYKYNIIYLKLIDFDL